VGTSVNQPSPNTPNWRLARAVLGRPDAAPTDQVAELWLAAAADRARVLEKELADPLLAKAAEIASAHRQDPQRAMAEFDRTVYESRTTNFVLELGRRALARATLMGTGAEGFAAELFSETTSYYVARDLPGFVGSPNRVGNAHDALKLKAELQSVTRTLASAGDVSVDVRSWARYVAATIERLTRRGEPR
jgi:hypothetical protein